MPKNKEKNVLNCIVIKWKTIMRWNMKNNKEKRLNTKFIEPGMSNDFVRTKEKGKKSIKKPKRSVHIKSGKGRDKGK